jgi:hypothetical protein
MHKHEPSPTSATSTSLETALVASVLLRTLKDYRMGQYLLVRDTWLSNIMNFLGNVSRGYAPGAICSRVRMIMTSKRFVLYQVIRSCSLTVALSSL